MLNCKKNKGITRMPLTNSNRPLDVICHWHKDNELNLETPYQRGVVWGVKRQQNFIKSVLLGIPIPSIVVNCRDHWQPIDYSYAVIDGKQRCTSILNFCYSKLPIPSEWVAHEGQELVFYNELEEVLKRRIKNMPLPFSEGRLDSIEEEEAVFNLVNFGGLQQGESDYA